MSSARSSISLRPFQAEAISALSSTKSAHVICVAPTGSGKSLVYETLAARPGTRTLLVTPLVALGRQQAMRLRQAGVRVRLGMGEGAQGPMRDPSGPTAWIVSPERLYPTGNGVKSRAALLEGWHPNLLVVDECHCLSEWGEGFRPSFARIPQLIQSLRIPQSLWLTATLTFEARQALRELLPSPVQEIGRFGLPERLRFRAVRSPWGGRAQTLLREIFRQRENQGPQGIVFVSTRRGSERVLNLLTAARLNSAAYHAGLSHEERLAVEARVASGDVDVVVATSAFGMGMDYPMLRWVILWQAPFSLLSLAQCLGRVGRAGREGSAVLLWDEEDFRLIEWSGLKTLREVHDYLRSATCRVTALVRHFEGGRVNREVLSDCGACDSCLAKV